MKTSTIHTLSLASPVLVYTDEPIRSGRTPKVKGTMTVTANRSIETDRERPIASYSVSITVFRHENSGNRWREFRCEGSSARRIYDAFSKIAQTQYLTGNGQADCAIAILSQYNDFFDASTGDAATSLPEWAEAFDALAKNYDLI